MREGREGGNRIEGEPGCPWATIVAEGSEDWEKWEEREEGKEGNVLFVFYFYFWGEGPVRLANWGGDKVSKWLGGRHAWASERGGDSPRKCWRSRHLLGTGRLPGLGCRGKKERT